MRCSSRQCGAVPEYQLVQRGYLRLGKMMEEESMDMREMRIRFGRTEEDAKELNQEKGDEAFERRVGIKGLKQYEQKWEVV